MENKERIPFPQRSKNHAELYADTPDWGPYPDCPDCGETMGYSHAKGEFKCPECGYTMSVDDAIALQIERDGEEDDKPFVCRTCGGPWPDCRTSCKMFDD